MPSPDVPTTIAARGETGGGSIVTAKRARCAHSSSRAASRSRPSPASAFHSATWWSTPRRSTESGEHGAATGTIAQENGIDAPTIAANWPPIE